MLRYLQPRFLSTLKVPIEAIKRLRDETSAPISQCKTALEESNLSHEQALAWLKKKGLLQAEKRLNKETREGVIGAMVTSCRSKVALVEVNCETDFVAKNDLFISFVNNLMARAIEAEYVMDYDKGEEVNKDEIEAFLHHSASTGLFPEDSSIETLHEEYKVIISRLQENIRVRRIITLHSDKSNNYLMQRSMVSMSIKDMINMLVNKPQLLSSKSNLLWMKKTKTKLIFLESLLITSQLR